MYPYGVFWDRLYIISQANPRSNFSRIDKFWKIPPVRGQLEINGKNNGYPLGVSF